MADTIITVRGAADAHRTAEHATVRLTASADGPERDRVVADATAAAATVTGALAAELDASAGPVVAWSSDGVRVWSDRPWSQDGAQLPLVFHAAIAVTAQFADVEALSRFVDAASRTEFVAVDGVEWRLTESTMREVETEVRAAAVAAALRKAHEFAAAVGLAEVVPLAIADPGLLGDGGPGAPAGGPHGAALFARAAVDHAAPSIDLTPGLITVAAEVDARFAAS